MTMKGSTIRLDSELRKELIPKLSEVGLSLNGYITLAVKQFLIQGKVPFEIKTKSNVEKVKFNDQTRQAIIRAHAEEEGKISNTSQKFTNVNDLMEDLFGESK